MEAGWRETALDSPDALGDMDATTTPLHHHARGRHDQPLGRERRHHVRRFRRSPGGVRHWPRYRPMQRCRDPGPIQRFALCRSGQDRRPTACGRRDPTRTPAARRLRPGWPVGAPRRGSSLLHRRQRRGGSQSSTSTITSSHSGVSVGSCEPTRAGACESCSLKTTTPILRSSTYETSRTERRHTIGADRGRPALGPFDAVPFARYQDWFHRFRPVPV
jgi:hypothetical protein